MRSLRDTNVAKIEGNLDQELKLIGEYGLKNKREVWRVKYTLAKIRKAARDLLTLEDKDQRRSHKLHVQGLECMRTGKFGSEKNGVDLWFQCACAAAPLMVPTRMRP